MSERSLTVGEIMRYANHDFLNHLQLISMHLQMGNIEAAHERIEEFQQQSQQISKLSKVQLPKTVGWLLTAKWRFPALQLTIVNEGSSEADTTFDELLASYLEHTVIHVYNALDPFVEQSCVVTLTNDPNFRLIIELKGKWDVTESLQYAKSEVISINIVEQHETTLKVIFIKE
ncbi:MAG: Spo0B domain-containing protein [Lysinibacillus sp.]